MHNQSQEFVHCCVLHVPISSPKNPGDYTKWQFLSDQLLSLCVFESFDRLSNMYLFCGVTCLEFDFHLFAFILANNTDSGLIGVYTIC